MAFKMRKTAEDLGLLKISVWVSARSCLLSAPSGEQDKQLVLMINIIALLVLAHRAHPATMRCAASLWETGAFLFKRQRTRRWGDYSIRQMPDLLCQGRWK